MRLHYLQHVPFEDPASILDWAKDKGFTVSKTRLYENDLLPKTDDFDWLVVMGGPMNIYEEKIYPWLRLEKDFISNAIKANKVVIGICLGAQLIADVLGGKVEKNAYKEIGWYPIKLTEAGKNIDIFDGLPDELTVFHWHGDTFNLPEKCVQVAKSEGCANQVFVYNGKVLGLQCHLECTQQAIMRLIENSRDEIVDGRYVQSEKEMLLGADKYLGQLRIVMYRLLDNLARNFGK